MVFFYEKPIIAIDEYLLTLCKLIGEICHISVGIKHIVAKSSSIRLLKKS
jgi:hypothetical protein